MQIQGRILALVSLSLAAACSGGQRSDVNSALPYAGLRSGAGPLTKQYGVGLGTFAALVGSPSGGDYGWCDGVVENPSQCTGEVPGVRRYTYALKKRAKLQYESTQDGYEDFDISAESKLGTGSYLMSAEVNELHQKLKGVSVGSQVVNSSWNDTLKISSKSLRNGTPVTIGVQLALLNASNDIACDAAQNSFGQLELYSASVTPPKSDGSEFEIAGYCVGGVWEYYLYGNTKNSGTTAVGTIGTAVGDSASLDFSLAGNVIACQTSNECVGDITASLGGKYKFTITSITKGATYKSASGQKYQ